MPERDGYIAGVPCWVDTSQPDPDAAAEFYGGLFGWEFEDAMPAGAPAKYLIGRLRGGEVAAVSSPPEGAPAQAVWNTYIWVENADESAAKARDAGGAVLSEPFDVMDAGRMAVLADPEGAAFCVWQARRHRGARVVNEPGSLNFNVLNTRDREGAKRFYGAVFGWKTLDLGSGEFWTLSAYGDYLEALTPGTRERTAELGAAGFEEVVAAITPIAGRDAETRAHWGVTFSTRTPTRRRRRRPSSAARCLVAPVDAPYARTHGSPRPAGRDLLRHRVRAREQGRRPRRRLTNGASQRARAPLLPTPTGSSSRPPLAGWARSRRDRSASRSR